MVPEPLWVSNKRVKKSSLGKEVESFEYNLAGTRRAGWRLHLLEGSELHQERPGIWCC